MYRSLFYNLWIKKINYFTFKLINSNTFSYYVKTYQNNIKTPIIAEFRY
jgi:hypothetical protein